MAPNIVTWIGACCAFPSLSGLLDAQRRHNSPAVPDAGAATYPAPSWLQNEHLLALHANRSSTWCAQQRAAERRTCAISLQRTSGDGMGMQIARRFAALRLALARGCYYVFSPMEGQGTIGGHAGAPIGTVAQRVLMGFAEGCALETDDPSTALGLPPYTSLTMFRREAVGGPLASNWDHLRKAEGVDTLAYPPWIFPNETLNHKIAWIRVTGQVQPPRGDALRRAVDAAAVGLRKGVQVWRTRAVTHVHAHAHALRMHMHMHMRMHMCMPITEKERRARTR